MKKMIFVGCAGILGLLSIVSTAPQNAHADPGGFGWCYTATNCFGEIYGGAELTEPECSSAGGQSWKADFDGSCYDPS